MNYIFASKGLLAMNFFDGILLSNHPNYDVQPTKSELYIYVKFDHLCRSNWLIQPMPYHIDILIIILFFKRYRLVICYSLNLSNLQISAISRRYSKFA
jgi:hypothetical protein